jgi:hypothetical protein
MERILQATPERLQAGLERRSAVRDEHQQLKYFEGKWTHRNQFWFDPNAAPLESQGTSTVEALHDGRHYRLTHDSDVLGDRVSSQSMIGFDNLREEFVTSSTDSLSTGMFVGYGPYDPDEKTYTFYGRVPNLRNPSASIRIRLVRRIIDNDHYVMEWYEMHGGKEIKTQQSEFTRQQ